jgi:hypothetical protein
VRRLFTTPLLAMLLLGGCTVALLIDMHVQWALATVAAASGVSLSGST